MLVQSLILLCSHTWAHSALDATCADADTMDEAVALDMKVQLLQTNDVPSNPKQIRLQAQQKRTKLMVEEAQKWNALKREHKEEFAAARLAQVRDRDLMREMQHLEQQKADKEETEEKEEEETEEEEEGDADNDDDDDDDADEEEDEDANETVSTNLFARITAEKRTTDEQKALELQKNKRARALKQRAMQKHRSAHHPHADTMLAARDAALESAAEVMQAQGITPETLQDAKSMVVDEKLSLLAGPANKSAPSNMRAQLARQMLSEQEEQRQFAKKLRMAAAGTSEKEQKEEQEKALAIGGAEEEEGGGGRGGGRRAEV